MRNRKFGLNLLLFSLALAAVAGLQLVEGPANVAMATRVNPEDVCPTGGIKDDSGPTWEATTATDIIILDAVIKAGNETTAFTSDGTDGCYTVTGLGTCHATVTGGGTGPDCKQISHVVFCTGPGTSPTDCGPSPTPTPEPTPTPTPEPTPSPSPGL
jgi:hypothetical protein